ncbi:hypothetical protein D3C72_556020 [compost metagenome]
MVMQRQIQNLELRHAQGCQLPLAFAQEASDCRRQLEIAAQRRNDVLDCLAAEPGRAIPAQITPHALEIRLEPIEVCQEGLTGVSLVVDHSWIPLGTADRETRMRESYAPTEKVSAAAQFEFGLEILPQRVGRAFGLSERTFFRFISRSGRSDRPDAVGSLHRAAFDFERKDASWPDQDEVGLRIFLALVTGEPD